MASRGEARPDTAAGDVLGPAWSLRWRAPELALLLAERAGAVAKLAGEGPDRLKAEATVVVASCRLGQRLDVVERAIDAVRLAERHKDAGMAAALRVELAGCARTAGVPLVGAAVLRPVLTSDGVQPAVRADALVQMAGCLVQLADAGVVDDALAEADRLYAEDRDLDADHRVVSRALLRSVASGEQRRRGDARAAVHAAQEGADLLDTLNEPSSDSGEASAKVALRLVHGLLDLGWVDEASIVAGAELGRPVRAPAASAVGWLSLTVAVRKHLAAGAPNPALALIRDAADLAERHRLSALRAEALTTLSDAYERVGDLAEALDCLRTAQGVRLRRARSVYAARTKLIGAFGETTSPEEFIQLLGSPGGRRAAGARGGEQAASLLGRFGMRHPLAAAVTGARAANPGGTAPNTDVTMVLVDVTTAERGAVAGSGGQIGEQVVSKVLDRVRDAAPTDAQVARVGGAEFAVLLPSMRAGQTERWVEQLRGAMATVDWSSFTPGLAVNVRVAVAQQSGRAVAQPALAGSTRSDAASTPATPMPTAASQRSATPASAAPAAATPVGAAQWGSEAAALMGSTSSAPKPAAADSVVGGSVGSTAPGAARRDSSAGSAAGRSVGSPSSGAGRWDSSAGSVAGGSAGSMSADAAAGAGRWDSAVGSVAGGSMGSAPADVGRSDSSVGAAAEGSASADVVAGQWESAGRAGAAAPVGLGQLGSEASSATSSAPSGSGSIGSVAAGSVDSGSTGSGSSSASASSMFELPTVPLASLGAGRRSRSEQAPTGSPDAPDALAKALEQWHQSRAAKSGESRRAEPVQPGMLPAAFGRSAEPATNPRLKRPTGHQAEQTGQAVEPQAAASRPAQPDQTANAQQAAYTGQAANAQHAAYTGQAAHSGQAANTGQVPAHTASATPILPALPIPPPLEPEHPVSSSTVFRSSESAMARTPAIHSPTDAISSDPSVRISASDISAAFAKPPADPVEQSEQSDAAQRRHPDLDAPGLDMWMPGLPPSEPTMPWPIPSTTEQATPDPYRSPFADSPFADPIGDPSEPSRPRHAADAGHSVLSSLGITAGSGSGGGRRRAKEEPSVEPERQPEPDIEPTSGVARTVSFDDFEHIEPLPPVEEPPPPAKSDDVTFGDGAWVPLRYRRHELPVPHSPIASQPIPVPPPAEPVEQPAPEPETAPAAATSPREREHPATRTGGRRRRSVQLADLLTEAMMAYQTAQDSNEFRHNPLGQDPSSSLPGPTNLPAPLAGSVGLDPAVGDEPGYAGPARHRGDTHLGDSRWHATRWDSSDDLT